MSEHPRLLALLMAVLAISSAFLTIATLASDDSEAYPTSGSGTYSDPFTYGSSTDLFVPTYSDGYSNILPTHEYTRYYLEVGTAYTILRYDMVDTPSSYDYYSLGNWTIVNENGFNEFIEDQCTIEEIENGVTDYARITASEECTVNATAVVCNKYAEEKGLYYNPNMTQSTHCRIQLVFESRNNIDFDEQGGTTVSDESLIPGTSITLPSTYRSGYIFDGWYTAASGGTRVGGAGDSYIPSGDMTLYAHWRIMAINITSSAPTGSIVQYGNFAYTVTTDVSGCTISVSGADWISVSGNKLIGTPDQTGDYHITVTASKAGYESDTQSFTVKVISSLGFDTVPTAGMIVYEI